MKRAWAFLLVSLLWFPRAAVSTAERPLKATLTEARGDVQVSSAEGSAWEIAEPGATLAAGARIKTGADGAADLLFEDGTAMHLDKSASLTVETAGDKDGTREFSLRLWAGRLLSQVAKRHDRVNYRVRTPVAVAAVRGTEFVTDASEEAVELAVFEGAVETQSLKEGSPLGDPVAVSVDQEISLRRDRPAGRPRAVSRAMEEYRRGTADIFRKRIEGWRSDMSRVQKLQEELMERRRRGIENRMEERRKNDADVMREFRRRMRRGTAPADPPR